MWSKEVNDDECEGGFELTPTTLKKLCRDLKLYSSCPELNEVLHLHQKGIVKLKNLDEYTGLRTIYLECNAISKIEGLDQLVNLQCLYLNEGSFNQNLVEDISGLNKLTQLETLDLANNQDCRSIQSLDLSNNRIDDELALEMIRNLQLRLLRLIGNPIVSKTMHYRKKTITSIQELHYLDDSPVFEKDRRLAEAWTAGGLSAEQRTREIIRKEEADLREKHLKAFDELVQNAKARSQDKATQGRNTFYFEDNVMGITVESKIALDSIQQASTENDFIPLTLEDSMEEDCDTLGLHSQLLDPRKRDAGTFDPHLNAVTSARKLQKCSMSMEDSQLNYCGLIPDSINMEVEMSVPSSNFLDLYPINDLSSNSQQIAHESEKKEDGLQFRVANDHINMVNSKLTGCNVPSDNICASKGCVDFDETEVLKTVTSSNDNYIVSDLIQGAQQNHDLIENVLTH